MGGNMSARGTARTRSEVFIPLDEDSLQRVIKMMELSEDGESVRIVGTNITFPLNEVISLKETPQEQFGEVGVLMIIIAYVLVSVIGALGNALVLFIILSRPKMKVLKHVFIANLAASDFIVCALTTPLTLLELLEHPIGTMSFMCKVVAALPATSVYVSTLSITAIALERYKVIVYSTNPTPSRKIIVGLIVCGIWLVSVGLSMPFLIFRKQIALGIPGIRLVYSCTEVWPIIGGRAIYSIFCMLLQYCMPSLIIGAAHLRIVLKLRRRFTARFEGSQVLANGHHSHGEESEVLEAIRGRRKRQKKRQRKTNLLLCMIALIFALCWLPINVVNIVSDFSSDLFTEYMHVFQKIFVACHLFAMSSAVANPILYGFLNENFRQEFRHVFLFWLRTCCGRTFGLERHVGYLATTTEITMKDRHPAELTAL